MTVNARELERQRIDHLVLEQPRPRPELVKPEGMAKQAWKAERRRLIDRGVELAPGIEERVALREDWRGMAGTPETYAHVAGEAARPGALARLVATGAIDLHQLAAAEEIGLAFTRTVADVAVRTANWSRGFGAGRPVDASAVGNAHAYLDLAYTAWRAAAGSNAAMLLAIIVDDIGITIAARRYRMSNRRALRLLGEALDRWRRA